MIQVLFLLLNEMHIPENFQFRLIGIGVYQLQTKADDFQLSLLIDVFLFKRTSFRQKQLPFDQKLQ